VLHFRNTSDDRVLSAILERWGVIISPPWFLKFLLWVPQSTRCTCISIRSSARFGGNSLALLQSIWSAAAIIEGIYETGSY